MRAADFKMRHYPTPEGLAGAHSCGQRDPIPSGTHCALTHSHRWAGGIVGDPRPCGHASELCRCMAEHADGRQRRHDAKRMVGKMSEADLFDRGIWRSRVRYRHLQRWPLQQEQKDLAPLLASWRRGEVSLTTALGDSEAESCRTAALGTYGHLECCVVSAESFPWRGRPLILVTGVVLVDEPASGIDIAVHESPTKHVIGSALLVILVDARKDHVLRVPPRARLQFFSF